MGINHITLVGNVVRNPEMRMTPNGIPTTQFTVAVKRPPREGSTYDVTDYIKVVTWRTLAETVNSTIKKDHVVSVEGALRTRSYEQDGQRKKVVEVEAQHVHTISGPVGAPAQAEPEAFPDFEDAPAFGDTDEIPF
ncbi:single-stranded DNA-binding protein [bacterium]|nr:single-stranded DNA-binding protein [bacterium]